MHQLLVLRLEDRRYALRLRDVERVLRMVEVTPLPEAPPSVLGVVNVEGRVLTVVDLRRCCGLPPLRIDPDQVMVLVHRDGRAVALAADGVEGVVNWPERKIVPASGMEPPPAYIEGVAKLPDRLVPILDLQPLMEIALSSEAPGRGEVSEDEGQEAS